MQSRLLGDECVARISIYGGWHITGGVAHDGWVGYTGSSQCTMDMAAMELDGALLDNNGNYVPSAFKSANCRWPVPDTTCKSLWVHGDGECGSCNGVWAAQSFHRFELIPGYFFITDAGGPCYTAEAGRVAGRLL